MNTKNEKREEKEREMLSQNALESVDCKSDLESLRNLHL